MNDTRNNLANFCPLKEESSIENKKQPTNCPVVKQKTNVGCPKRYPKINIFDVYFDHTNGKRMDWSAIWEKTTTNWGWKAACGRHAPEKTACVGNNGVWEPFWRSVFWSVSSQLVWWQGCCWSHLDGQWRNVWNVGSKKQQLATVRKSEHISK